MDPYDPQDKTAKVQEEMQEPDNQDPSSQAALNKRLNEARVEQDQLQKADAEAKAAADQKLRDEA